jgi:hypothetical protein
MLSTVCLSCLELPSIQSVFSLFPSRSHFLQFVFAPIIYFLATAGLLGCGSAFTYKRVPTFRGNILLPSSVLKSSLSFMFHNINMAEEYAATNFVFFRQCPCLPLIMSSNFSAAIHDKYESNWKSVRVFLISTSYFDRHSIPASKNAACKGMAHYESLQSARKHKNDILWQR